MTTQCVIQTHGELSDLSADLLGLVATTERHFGCWRVRAEKVRNVAGEKLQAAANRWMKTGSKKGQRFVGFGWPWFRLTLPNPNPLINTLAVLLESWWSTSFFTPHS